MKLSSGLSLVAIMSVLILGVGYLTFGVLRIDVFSDSINVTLRVPQAGSLLVGSPILLRGVRVGEIASIEKAERGVEMQLALESRYRIPATGTATVEDLSGLGEPYIEFVPKNGAGPYLTDGQRLDAVQVILPRSIPDVAQTVTGLLEQLNPQAISNIVKTLDQALTGTDTVMPRLAASTTLLSETILSRSPAIRSILVDLQTMGADMAWAGPGMAAAGPLWDEAGMWGALIADSIARLARIGTMPDDYLQGNGVVPFLGEVTEYLSRIGPDLQELAPAVQPLADSAAMSMPQIDISDLIARALSATGDSALNVRIGIK
ncbi:MULTISPECIES: MlaD family protein [Nocardia]|uniref:Mce family protein n=3 Tax=Actinomycetes TaxID=1760 RepID=U5E3R0_NOCAS|nr:MULTISPECIES: MlaD family protein [Nocardia]UGT50826.1 MlaD family protein [Nocardia asteroides]GAD82967.1 Mce family protein [Nocardia asteroides NBRC 15531]SFN87337.1 virulence factor Mce family protein [Nocardia asteroides]VEG36329.1 virulence factor Mce family protein [Nocardia asteroides]